MQTDAEVAAIAAGLTKASRRALVRIGKDWTEEGSPGPARSDAYSLWWGRDRKHRLVEQPKAYAISAGSCRWKWRLSKRGLRVAQHLKQENAK